MRPRCWLAAPLMLTLALACSDDDTGQTTDSAVPDLGAGADGTTADTGATPDTTPAGSCKPGEAINACTGAAVCKATRDCSLKGGKDLAGSCVNSLCVPDPSADAKVKVNGKFTGTPDLSCLTTAPALPAGPAKATVWGKVTVFGLEETTVGAKLEIFDEGADPDLKTPLGTHTTVAAKAAGTTCTAACGSGKVCMHGKCVKDKDGKFNPIGYFQIKDIPTNKLLVFRASGTGFAATVQYNLWLPADKVGADSMIYEEAYVISDLSKKLIAAAAGVSSIPPGAAAIAGEIHDCKDDVVKGATVSLSLLPQKLTYFDNAGMPDTSATSTHEDGLYAAVNIKPPAGGVMTVAAAARVGGKATRLASYKVKVFADAITIFTSTPWFPGMKK